MVWPMQLLKTLQHHLRNLLENFFTASFSLMSNGNLACWNLSSFLFWLAHYGSREPILFFLLVTTFDAFYGNFWFLNTSGSLHHLAQVILSNLQWCSPSSSEHFNIFFWDCSTQNLMLRLYERWAEVKDFVHLQAVRVSTRRQITRISQQEYRYWIMFASKQQTLLWRRGN